MRVQRLNGKTVYHSAYTGRVAVTDSDGNYTGEYTDTFGAPLAIRATVQQTNPLLLEKYGLASNGICQLVLSTTDGRAIAQTDRLWIGKTPNTNCTDYNYMVERIIQHTGFGTYLVFAKEVLNGNT